MCTYLIGVFDDGLAVFFLEGNGDRISGTFQDSTLQDLGFKRDNERLPVSSEAATSYTGEHVFRRIARMDGIIVVSETLNRDWETAPPRVSVMGASFSDADNYCSFAALTLHNKINERWSQLPVVLSCPSAHGTFLIRKSPFPFEVLVPDEVVPNEVVWLGLLGLV